MKTSYIYIHTLLDRERISKIQGNTCLISKDMISSEKKRLKEENKTSKVEFITTGLSRPLRRQALRLLKEPIKS